MSESTSYEPDLMKIGELARRTGVNQRLLRYYEEQGLLSSQRAPSGYRYYSPEAVTVVRQIRQLLAAGLTTEVIRDILPCARGEVPTLDPCPDLVRTLRRELGNIDDRISCLQQTRGALVNFLDATDRVAG